MYTFICTLGHLSYSAAKQPNDDRCPHCTTFCYRIVTGADAHAAGANTHDCTRRVQHPNGAILSCHSRLGLAYSHRELANARLGRPSCG